MRVIVFAVRLLMNYYEKDSSEGGKMRLDDLTRASILMELMKVANPETTVADMELIVSNIERILIDGKYIKCRKTEEKPLP
jgi:hypothetical protein